jgi:hypothetical protein
MAAACREYFGKEGFTDVISVEGCNVLIDGDERAPNLQCMFTCNSGTSCPDGVTDPNKVYKLFDYGDGCPGYENATTLP